MPTFLSRFGSGGVAPKTAISIFKFWWRVEPRLNSDGGMTDGPAVVWCSDQGWGYMHLPGDVRPAPMPSAWRVDSRGEGSSCPPAGAGEGGQDHHGDGAGAGDGSHRCAPDACR